MPDFDQLATEALSTRYLARRGEFDEIQEAGYPIESQDSGRVWRVSWISFEPATGRWTNEATRQRGQIDTDELFVNVLKGQLGDAPKPKVETLSGDQEIARSVIKAIFQRWGEEYPAKRMDSGTRKTMLKDIDAAYPFPSRRKFWYENVWRREKAIAFGIVLAVPFQSETSFVPKRKPLPVEKKAEAVAQGGLFS